MCRTPFTQNYSGCVAKTPACVCLTRPSWHSLSSAETQTNEYPPNQHTAFCLTLKCLCRGCDCICAGKHSLHRHACNTTSTTHSINSGIILLGTQSRATAGFWSGTIGGSAHLRFVGKILANTIVTASELVVPLFQGVIHGSSGSAYTATWSYKDKDKDMPDHVM